VTFRSASVSRWSVLGAAVCVAAGLAMLVFGGGCATGGLIRNTGVHVEVPVRFTRILATEREFVVEFDAFTELSPLRPEYAQQGPVAPRWAAVPIDEIFGGGTKRTVRSGQLPLPADLASAVSVARRSGDVFVPEEEPQRFEVILWAHPTHDNSVSLHRLADRKSGGFNTDLFIRRPRDAWAYPAIVVVMPFALLWDGVTLPFWGTYLLLLMVVGT
jgi:hypothetical protein